MTREKHVAIRHTHGGGALRSRRHLPLGAAQGQPRRSVARQAARTWRSGSGSHDQRSTIWRVQSPLLTFTEWFISSICSPSIWVDGLVERESSSLQIVYASLIYTPWFVIVFQHGRHPYHRHWLMRRLSHYHRALLQILRSSVRSLIRNLEKAPWCSR